MRQQNLVRKYNMYTVKITGKTLNKAQNTLTVNVDVTNNGETFSKSFAVPDNASFIEVKRTIKRYIERLELADASIASITEGTIDLATITQENPTQAQIEKSEWFADFRRLEQVQRLITLGALTGNETPVANLRNKVKDNFKPAYIAEM